mmetsp:Transcript_531/g.928  ORF Transcript_531/g.928 Transcript_531/m.928 type:complete len:100 (-) Transcript_531:44-343(-)
MECLPFQLPRILSTARFIRLPLQKDRLQWSRKAEIIPRLPSRKMTVFLPAACYLNAAPVALSRTTMTRLVKKVFKKNTNDRSQPVLVEENKLYMYVFLG